MTQQIRKAVNPLPPSITLVGNAGNYTALLGKQEIGTVARLGRRCWTTSCGDYSATMRAGAQALVRRFTKPLN